MDKETSARVSSIASGLLDFRPPELIAIVDSRDKEKIELHCESVRTLADTGGDCARPGSDRRPKAHNLPRPAEDRAR